MEEGSGRLHPQAGRAPEIEATPDALGFSIPLTPEEVNAAILAAGLKKSKRRGHRPARKRHYMNTAEIVWRKDGGSTIVWEEE